MAAMMIEELEPLVDPRIEAGLHVPRDFPDHVLAILEPLQFRTRRRRPDRFFAFLAVISKSHRSRMYREKEKRPSHDARAFSRGYLES